MAAPEPNDPKDTREPKDTYRTVSTTLWTDKKFRSLSKIEPSGQALWLWLLTTRREKCLIPGLIFAWIGTISDALSWSSRAVRRCLQELIEAQMIIVDDENRIIFLPKAIKYNPPSNQSVVAGWGKSWPEIPEGTLRNTIHDVLLEGLKGKDASWTEAFLKACPRWDGGGEGVGQGAKDPGGQGGGHQIPGTGYQSFETSPPKGVTVLVPPSGSDPANADGTSSPKPSGASLPQAPADAGGNGPWLTPEDTPTTHVEIPDEPGEDPSAPVTTSRLQPSEVPCLDADFGDDLTPEDRLSLFLPKAQPVLDAWNTAADSHPNLARVDGPAAIEYIGDICRIQANPVANEDLLFILSVIPGNPWYVGEKVGGNGKPFVASLGYYVRMGFAKLHEVAEKARKAKNWGKPIAGRSKPKHVADYEARIAAGKGPDFTDNPDNIAQFLSTTGGDNA